MDRYPRSCGAAEFAEKGFRGIHMRRRDIVMVPEQSWLENPKDHLIAPLVKPET